MNIKDFNAEGIISPASGKKWNFDDVLRKLHERSLINAEQNSTICLYDEQVGEFGDVDLTMKFSTKLESQWTNSPTVELYDVRVPIHITQNGQWLNGFNYGINGITADPHDYIGMFRVASEEKSRDIYFDFDELSIEERNKIVDFAIALGIQEQRMNTLKVIRNGKS